MPYFHFKKEPANSSIQISTELEARAIRETNPRIVVCNMTKHVSIADTLTENVAHFNRNCRKVKEFSCYKLLLIVVSL
jgi:hypothetical protein